MTIDELKQYCSSEFQSIDRVLDELFTVYKSDKPEYTLSEQSAMAAFLMNIYSGMENVLKQMLIYDKLEIDDSPGWHEKVLRKSGEIGILLPDQLQMLSKYLSFRNYFIYSYVFTINWEDLRVLVEAVKDVTMKIRSEIDEYLRTI